MSDDRNNDFDDFQGFDGSNDFGDPNADGMHFSEEELEAAMAGFEQEFKDAEASKHERRTIRHLKLSIPPKLPITRNPPNPPNPRESTTCSTRLRIR